MDRTAQQHPDYVSPPDDIDKSSEKYDHSPSGDRRPVGADNPPRNHSGVAGEVYDPYGGKKLGMIRVISALPPSRKLNTNREQTTLIFFTNQVGIGILSLPSFLHTVGLIPGIFTSKCDLKQRLVELEQWLTLSWQLLSWEFWRPTPHTF